MRFPILITFHADLSGAYYKNRAKDLARRCEELNLEFVVCNETENIRAYIDRIKRQCPKVKSRRNKIVRWIPTFIERQLRQLQRPVLWVHCDATIRRVPRLTSFDGLSVGYGMGAGKYNPKVKVRNHKILACPVYMKPDNTAYNFLDRWIDYCNRADREKGEHYWLQNLCKELSCRPGIGQLPNDFVSRDPESNVHSII